MANAATAQSKLDRYFADYASHHRTSGNQATHYIGIPMIVIALFGLLSNIRIAEFGNELFRLDGGFVLWALGALFYLALNWKLALPFSLVTLGFYFLGRALSLELQIAGFILGWVIQFVGHIVWEKKSPAFKDNLVHLMIGPFWIFAKLVGYWK